MKKILLVIPIFLILFSLSCFAITPIDDRPELIFSTINKVYFSNALNASFICASDYPIKVHKLIDGDLVAMYYTGDIMENIEFDIPYGYIFYTSYVDGVYTMEGQIYIWSQANNKYNLRTDTSSMQFSSLVRSNNDILEFVNGNDFLRIYFSKDSALNILPVAQKTDENIHTLTFVFLILLGLILGGYSYVHK